MYVNNWFGVEDGLILGLLRDPDQAPPSTDNSQGGRFLSAQGELLCTTATVGFTDTYNGAFRISPEGAVRILENPGAIPVGTMWNQGLPFSAIGQLLVVINGGVDHYVAGLPVNIFGVPCFGQSQLLPPTSFFAPLTTSLVPASGSGSLVPTFTRATTAYVADNEGILRQAAIGEARFQGARRVRNWVPKSEAFTDASWQKLQSGTGVAPNVTAGFIGPTGAANACRAQFSLGATPVSALSRLFLGNLLPAVNGRSSKSVWVKSNTGANQSIYINGDGGAFALITATAAWQRFGFSDSIDVNINSYGQLQFGCVGAGIGLGVSSDTTADILVFGAQIEDVSGASNQAPSEYVSVGVLSAPYHGAGIDGVKYFSTTNGNSVSGNVVTEANGTPIPAATRLGYLSEGVRTNICLQSQTFGTPPSWQVIAADAEITVDQYAAPDGTTTGDQLKAKATNSTHYIIQNPLNTTAAAHTFSAYLRYTNHRWAVLDCYDGTTDRLASFDLLNGVVGAVSAATTSTITAVGGGWYRCTMTMTTAAGAGYVAIGLNNSDSSTLQLWLAAGTETVGLWGAQLEAAAFASSYIPTVAASVTRNADVLTYPTAGNASVTVGSAYAEVSPATVFGTNGRIINLGYGSTNTDNTQIFVENSGGPISSYDGGTVISTANSLTTSGVNKAVTAYSGASRKLCLNGGAVASGLFDGSFNDSPNIGIGCYNPAGLFGTIRNVRIWPVALTDAQLIGITTP